MAVDVLSPGEVRQESAPVKTEQEWEQNLSIHLICPDCREDPPNLIEEFSSGDIVCTSCGVVLTSHVVDTRSEWRTFSNDDQGNDDPSRVGDAANPLLHGSQLETNIAFGAGDSRSRELHRAQNKSTEHKSNSNLKKAFGQIASYCASIQLSLITADMAKQYYKLAEESRAFKGKSQDAIIASCIIIATRQHNGSSRSFNEVCNLTHVSKKELGKTFKQLQHLLNKEVKKKTGAGGAIVANEYDAASTTSADELCRRFCSHLGLPASVSRIAEELARRILDAGSLDGRSPLTVAAATIYFAASLMGEAITTKDIARVAGVSDGTIRNSYKMLKQDADKLVKQEWLDKGGNIAKLPQT